MKWIVKEEQYDKDARKHAGGKAREDINRIVSDCNYSHIVVQCPQQEREHASLLRKFVYHTKAAIIWRKALQPIRKGDALLLQFPVMNHTLFLNGVLTSLKKRGVQICAIIHDLEIIRMSNDSTLSKYARWRMKKEEIDELYEFDKIIVHNDAMKEFLMSRLGIDEERLIVLGIFDYLIDEQFVPDRQIENWKSCIIAGNLNRKKSNYIYNLPSRPDFELYGVNFEGSGNENIHYHGSFLADELPCHLKGGFGLVWDGDSADTCSGAWGEYLRYNNPHKTSLYLACGIPVIIWKEAALAEFVKDNNVGITVGSLKEVEDKLRTVTEEEYSACKKNAMALSKKLRAGFHTKEALKAVGLID